MSNFFSLLFFCFIFALIFSGCEKDETNNSEIETNDDIENSYSFQEGALGINISISDSLVEKGKFITFYDSSNVESREWYFEGGNPFRSSAKSVKVYYYDSDDYDFSLTVYKDTIMDSLIRKDFIKIIDQGFYIGKRGDEYNQLVKLDRAQDIITQVYKTELASGVFLKSTMGEGFNVIEVNDGYKYFGPADDYKIIEAQERVPQEPKFDFFRGSFIPDTNEFLLGSSDIYYVGIDFEINKIVLVPYYQWGVIGSAFNNVNGDEIVLEQGSMTSNSFSYVFGKNEIVEGSYNIRFNGAQMVILDHDYYNGNTYEKGIQLDLTIGYYNGECGWGVFDMKNEIVGNVSGELSWNYDDGFDWKTEY